MRNDREGISWIPHHTGSPRTAMRGPERKGEAFICRYSWIPHQVRNDREGISGFRVTPGHPAQRCGVHWWVFLDSASHRVTPHHDAGSIGGYYLCQYSWIPHQVRNDVKHRVEARYDVAVTPHHDAGSSKVPLVGIAFAGIPGFRIKCGMT